MQSPKLTKRTFHTTYEGIRHPDDRSTAGDVVVLVDGQVLPLSPSLKLFCHSPAGFNWGYGGSGPAQLALAILLDYYGQNQALMYYQSFKADVVAHWPEEDGFKITGAQIDDWKRAHAIH